MGQISEEQKTAMILASMLAIEQEATSYDDEDQRAAFHAGAQTALHVILASLKTIIRAEKGSGEEH